MTTESNSSQTRRMHPHGQICYLQIPARDPLVSAAFYEHVFGWRIGWPHANFEAPALLGEWVTDRAPSTKDGPLLWISVDRLDDAIATVAKYGGTLVNPPKADGPRTLATFQDPAGNIIGLAQH